MTNTMQQLTDMPKNVADALMRGEREEAIVALQQERNLSREDAREVIASCILLTPGLRMKDTLSEARWGRMGWLVLFQAIVVAIGYFVFFHGKW